MSLKQTIRNVMAGIFLVFGVAFVATPLNTYALEKCGNVETSIISCEQSGTGDVENSGLWGLLLLAINILTAGVGVAALGGIVYGSILYTSAGGNQEQVKKALGVFSNVVIGVVAFAGMWALLNFLVPGGVF
jgi:hypothetical protein